MRFVDDGPIQIGCELADRAAAVVHPRLDDPDVAPGDLFDGGARACHRRHRIGRLPHVVGTNLGERREAAARSQKPRGIGVRLVSNLKRQLAKVRAHGLARGDAEVREAMQVVEDVFPGVVLGPAREVLHVTDVGVRVDERWNHRLARQIDASRSGRRLHVAFLPTRVNLSFSTTNALFSSGSLPSPAISLAPSKTVIAVARAG